MRYAIVVVTAPGASMLNDGLDAVDELERVILSYNSQFLFQSHEMPYKLIRNRPVPDNVPKTDFDIVQLEITSDVSLEGTKHLLEHLDNLDIVHSIEEEPIFTLQCVEHVENIGYDTWHLGCVANNQDFAPNNRFKFLHSGRGQRIHIIDTGVNIEHEEFGGRAQTFASLRSDNQSQPGINCQNPYDCNGHGTHVASLAAGYVRGVAKQATILSTRALSADGTGQYRHIHEAIDLISSRPEERGSIVIMSLGGGRSSALNHLIKKASQRGILFVVAAGNERDDACYYSPAGSREAITVGSHDFDGRASAFSNYGDCVTVYAPGEDMLAAYVPHRNSYCSLQGTSMSAPLVAGMVAVLREQNPALTEAAQFRRFFEYYSKKLAVSKDDGRALTTDIQATPCDYTTDHACVVIEGDLTDSSNDSCDIDVTAGKNTCQLRIYNHQALMKYYGYPLVPFMDGKLRAWLFTHSTMLPDEVSERLRIRINQYWHHHHLEIDLKQNQSIALSVSRVDSLQRQFTLFLQLPQTCLVQEPPCAINGPCVDHVCQCKYPFIGFDCAVNAQDFDMPNAMSHWWSILVAVIILLVYRNINFSA